MSRNSVSRLSSTIQRTSSGSVLACHVWPAAAESAASSSSSDSRPREPSKGSRDVRRSRSSARSSACSSHGREREDDDRVLGRPARGRWTSQSGRADARGPPPRALHQAPDPAPGKASAGVGVGEKSVGGDRDLGRPVVANSAGATAGRCAARVPSARPRGVRARVLGGRATRSRAASIPDVPVGGS